MKMVVFSNGQRFVGKYVDSDTKGGVSGMAQEFIKLQRLGELDPLYLELADGEKLVMFKEAVQRATFVFEE